MTQYLLSVYQPDGAPPPDVDLGQIMADLDVLNDELRSSGAWFFTGGLHQASSATGVRGAEGETLIIDGPFAATKEVLAGYYLLDSPDLDTVLKHAARVPHIAYGSVEVRPVIGADSQAQA